MNWISFHIFVNDTVYGRGFDIFLIHCIRPLLRELQESELISNYFFIRYAAKGPHIRLRVQINDPTTEEIIAKLVNEKTQDYLKENPAICDIKDFDIYLKSKKEATCMLPHGSILRDPYDKEYERYGGNQGLPVVEEEFFSSSKMILSLLDELSGYGFEERIGVGFLMMLTCIRLFTKTPKEAYRFSENLCRAYLDAEIGFTASDLWKEKDKLTAFLNTEYKELENPEPVVAFYEAFNSSYMENKSSIDRTLQDILKGKFRLCHDKRIINWTEHLKSTRNKLLALAQNNEMDVGNFTKLSPEKQCLSVAASLLHLNANRLGLHLIEEAWIAYIFNASALL